MNNITSAITKAKAAEAKIRHAEQGYSGISAGVRIEQEELNRLYELDLSLLTAVQTLSEAAKALADVSAAGDFANASVKLSALKSDLQEFISALDKRIITAAGILVEV